MNFAWTDIIGSIGVATITLTYILLQTERIKSESLSYSVLNMVGAGMIVFSLFYSFNFSAFVVEILWVVISLFGIGRYVFKRR